MIEHWRAASDLSETMTAFVVVTLIGSRGHVPQDLGAKAIVTASGLHSGTIGGGKVEARAIAFAQTKLAESKSTSASHPQTVTWNLTTDIEMTCGGEVTFLFEVHNPKRRAIALFGAGHVAQALVRILANLDFHVTCVDTREEWVAKLPTSGKLTAIRADDPVAKVEKFDSDTFFVVMTQGHATDLPILKKIFEIYPDAPYVGVMGSEIKAKKMRHDLLERGIAERLVERLHSPIGLPIGGNQPFEIAISVTAELLQAADKMSKNR